MARRTPAMFFGHGNPLNALADNAYTRAWSRMGAGAGKPQAIVSVSAHWFVPGMHVTAMDAPRTIHDFGGFPRDLYDVRYPAPGSARVAARVAELLAPDDVGMDRSWGLDHGTWSVLRHAYPDADVPVVQLSIDEEKPPQWHANAARRLTPLRDEGVLVIGSGNVVHNLHAYAWGRHAQGPYDWAQRFEERVRAFASSGDVAALADYESLGEDAMLSVPTPEHYLPLLYVLALRREDEPISFPIDGVDGGSISMLSVCVGS